MMDCPELFMNFSDFAADMRAVEEEARIDAELQLSLKQAAKEAVRERATLPFWSAPAAFLILRQCFFVVAVRRPRRRARPTGARRSRRTRRRKRRRNEANTQQMAPWIRWWRCMRLGRATESVTW